MSVCTSGKCGGVRSVNPQIEFVVRFQDETYSEPLSSLQAAYDLAAETGGQVRSRVKKEA